MARTDTNRCPYSGWGEGGGGKEKVVVEVVEVADYTLGVVEVVEVACQRSCMSVCRDISPLLASPHLHPHTLDTLRHTRQSKTQVTGPHLCSRPAELWVVLADALWAVLLLLLGGVGDHQHHQHQAVHPAHHAPPLHCVEQCPVTRQS